MRWIAGLIGIGVLVLLVAFGIEKWRLRETPLPVVTQLVGMDGLSCTEGLYRARELTRSAPEDARLAYYWLLTHCSEAPELPDAMIEAGALLAYHLQRPDEARQVYRKFLEQFPAHESGADVLLQLAKLDLDASDYPAAVARLTQLTQQYPNSPHRESAQFLAGRAAEMLAADRQSVRTPLGQLRQLVPNNVASAVLLLIGFVPAVYSVGNAAQKLRATQRTGAKLVIALVIVCILANFFANNFRKFQQINRVDSEIAALQ